MTGLDVTHDVRRQLLAGCGTLCGRPLRLSRTLPCRLPLLWCRPLLSGWAILRRAALLNCLALLL